MSISREEASKLMAEALSEPVLEAQVMLHETKAEALAVHYGAAYALRIAYKDAAKFLDGASKETLIRRLEGMAAGLDGVKRSRFTGHQHDAVGAAAGEFRSLAGWLVKGLG